jgi:DNA polymerase-3 subunit alpha
MKRAVELGMTHLAQTNHGTLSGWREFQKEADKAGIIPILGVEGYISETDRFDRRSKTKREDGTNSFNHIGILALNENGMRNVNAMMQEALTVGL